MIYGRSDSTLNRGGIRMGTTDFYAVVEGFDQVADSLVIDTTDLGARDEGELLCFLVVTRGATLEDVEPQLRKAVPQTHSGKKLEVPMKRILAGVGPDKAVSKDALQTPKL